MDVFDVLRVVSDLHLGGGAGQQIFRNKKLLADGIDALTAMEGKRVGLVLNGDIVDFLAELDAQTFDAVGAPRKLERIIRDPGFNDVFTALAAFVQRPDHTLVVVLGNHDVELALLDVQEVLLRKLSTPKGMDFQYVPIDTTVRGRVRFATQGYGYRCAVGGRSVYIFHGDMADGWNAVDHSGLRKCEHDLARGLPLRPPAVPPGTSLVVNHLNPVKFELPFSDLLKPEMEAAVDLVRLIKPGLTWKIPAIAGLLTRAKARAYAGTEYLSADMEGTAAEIGGDGTMARGDDLVAAALASPDKTPAELLGEGGGATLGLFTPTIEETRLRLVKKLNGDRGWHLAAEDEPLRWADTNQVNADLVIAGHTHLRRLRRRKNGTVYANSGTWIDLIRLDPVVDLEPTRFAAIVEWLKVRPLEALAGDPTFGSLIRARPTWVEVDANPDGKGATICLRDAIGSLDLPLDERVGDHTRIAV